MPRRGRLLIGPAFGRASIIKPIELPRLPRSLPEHVREDIEYAVAIARTLADPEDDPPPADVRATLRALTRGANPPDPELHPTVEALLDTELWRARNQPIGYEEAARRALRSFRASRRGRKRTREIARGLMDRVRHVLRGVRIDPATRAEVLREALAAAGFGASDASIRSGHYRR